MKIVIAIVLAVLLSACQTTKPAPILTTAAPVLVTTPKNLMVCPVLKEFPNPDTLTNKQLGDLLAVLYSYNQECFINMSAIKSYTVRVEAEYQEKYGQVNNVGGSF